VKLSCSATFHIVWARVRIMVRVGVMLSTTFSCFSSVRMLHSWTAVQGIPFSCIENIRVMIRVMVRIWARVRVMVWERTRAR
jgi:hypothetical protein